MLSPDKNGTSGRRPRVEKVRPLSRQEHVPPAEIGYRLFRPSISMVPREQRELPPRRRPWMPSGAVSIRPRRNRARFLPQQEHRQKAAQPLCNPAWQEPETGHLYRHPLLLSGAVPSRSSREQRSSRILLEHRDKVELPLFVPARQEPEMTLPLKHTLLLSGGNPGRSSREPANPLLLPKRQGRAALPSPTPAPQEQGAVQLRIYLLFQNSAVPARPGRNSKKLPVLLMAL